MALKDKRSIRHSRKGLLQPLQNTISAHSRPDEQEQRGNQGVRKNTVNSKSQRHGAVLCENTGCQDRLLASRDGKLPNDADDGGGKADQKNFQDVFIVLFILFPSGFPK